MSCLVRAPSRLVWLVLVLAAPGCALEFRMAPDAGASREDGGALDGGGAGDGGASDAAQPLDARPLDAGDAGVSCGDGGTREPTSVICNGDPCVAPRECFYERPDLGELCIPAVNNGARRFGDRELSAGRHHTCYLGNTGRVACWGDNSAGQLGGTPMSTTTSGRRYEHQLSVVVAGLEPAAEHLAAGDDFTCVSHLGDIVCWGGAARAWGPTPACFERARFALPEGHSIAYRTSDPGARAPHRALEAGAGYACAVSSAGAVWCWGRADRGQLGNDPAVDARMQPMPVRVPLQSGMLAVGVTAGVAHACAWSAIGEAQCWGANDTAQLGSGDRSPASAPVRVSVVAAPDRVLSMAAGAGHTCAVVDHEGTRRVLCWGANDFYQLGAGDLTASIATAVHVPSADGAIELATGYSHVCATMGVATGPRCWGANADGQVQRPSSGMVRADASFTTGEALIGSIYATGETHSCILIPNDSIRCDGANELLQLGFVAGAMEDPITFD